MLRILEDLPRPVKRRLQAEPAADRAALRAVLVQAEQAGIHVRPQDVWDHPTPLDNDSVRSVSKTLRTRVSKLLEGGQQ